VQSCWSSGRTVLEGVFHLGCAGAAQLQVQVVSRRSIGSVDSQTGLLGGQKDERTMTKMVRTDDRTVYLGRLSDELNRLRMEHERRRSDAHI
jgi:hypothetical protein